MDALVDVPYGGRSSAALARRRVGTTGNDRQANSTDIARNPTVQAWGACHRLTHAEAGVLALAACGKTNEEIARDRGSLPGTVRIQMSAIFRKLEVRNRGEAILIALRSGLAADGATSSTDTKPMNLGALLPHLEHRRFAAGKALFHSGDEATELYLVQRGRVRIEETGCELHDGDLFGEIGLFSPSRTRASSAICASTTSLFAMSAQKVKQLYVADAAFALFLLSSITRRLMTDTGYVA
jgi:DNA-binding CsgD family transcriptional regulator